MSHGGKNTDPFQNEHRLHHKHKHCAHDSDKSFFFFFFTRFQNSCVHWVLKLISYNLSHRSIHGVNFKTGRVGFSTVSQQTPLLIWIKESPQVHEGIHNAIIMFHHSWGHSPDYWQVPTTPYWRGVVPSLDDFSEIRVSGQIYLTKGQDKNKHMWTRLAWVTGSPVTDVSWESRSRLFGFMQISLDTRWEVRFTSQRGRTKTSTQNKDRRRSRQATTV